MREAHGVMIGDGAPRWKRRVCLLHSAVYGILAFVEDTLWTATDAASRLDRSARTAVAAAERRAAAGDPGIRRIGHAWVASPEWWMAVLAGVPKRAPRHRAPSQPSPAHPLTPDADDGLREVGGGARAVGIDEYLAWLYDNPPPPGVDGAEITEDLERRYPGGRGVTFRIGVSRSMRTVECGSTRESEYHTVYVCGGRVYDPRYSGTAVPFDEYIRHLSEINGGAKIEVNGGG